MSTTQIIVVLIFAVPAVIFIGSCHWWFRAFPNIPVMELFDYYPPVRSPYLNRSDFGNMSFLSLSGSVRCTYDV